MSDTLTQLTLREQMELDLGIQHLENLIQYAISHPTLPSQFSQELGAKLPEEFKIPGRSTALVGLTESVDERTIIFDGTEIYPHVLPDTINSEILFFE